MKPQEMLTKEPRKFDSEVAVRVMKWVEAKNALSYQPDLLVWRRPDGFWADAPDGYHYNPTADYSLAALLVRMEGEK